MFINQIRKGDILVAKEMRSGLPYWPCGPVITIDGNMVVIKDGENMRSFRPEELWTVPGYCAYLEKELWNLRQQLNGRQGTKPANGNVATTLMSGFIVAIAEGKVNGAVLQEVAKELRNKGVTPAAPQELIGVL